MVNKNEKPKLASHPSLPAIQNWGRNNRIVAQMTDGALNTIRGMEAVIDSRHRIGSYEFCDIDYKQITVWSKALNRHPEWVVEQLENAKILVTSLEIDNGECRWNDHHIGFKVTDGSIIELAWDFSILPIGELDFIKGMRVRFLAFSAGESGEISDRISKLSPDLPELERLWCGDDGVSLMHLDVAKLPNLRELYCSFNKLFELDISSAPNLSKLALSCNNISRIDLSRTPNLKALSLWNNQVVQIDLTLVPDLIYLDCQNNLIEKLDFTPTPNLTHLFCDGNHISELNLDSVPNLKNISCRENNIKELNIRSLKVPDEITIECDPRVRIIR